MSPEISGAELNAVEALGPLQAARFDRMAKTAEALRLVQAWAGCLAAILETRSGTVVEFLSAGDAYVAASARVDESLKTLGAALASKGTD